MNESAYTSQALVIRTVAVNIKVIQVDGRKMTKATFKQVQVAPGSVRFDDQQVLGWVNDRLTADFGVGQIWVLWADSSGGLYRSRVLLSPVMDLPEWVNGIKLSHYEVRRFAEWIKDSYDQLFIAT